MNPIKKTIMGIIGEAFFNTPPKINTIKKEEVPKERIVVNFSKKEIPIKS